MFGRLRYAQPLGWAAAGLSLTMAILSAFAAVAVAWASGGWQGAAAGPFVAWWVAVPYLLCWAGTLSRRLNRDQAIVLLTASVVLAIPPFWIAAVVLPSPDEPPTTAALFYLALPTLQIPVALAALMLALAVRTRDPSVTLSRLGKGRPRL